MNISSLPQEFAFRLENTDNTDISFIRGTWRLFPVGDKKYMFCSKYGNLKQYTYDLIRIGNSHHYWIVEDENKCIKKGYEKEIHKFLSKKFRKERIEKITRCKTSYLPYYFDFRHYESETYFIKEYDNKIFCLMLSSFNPRFEIRKYNIVLIYHKSEVIWNLKVLDNSYNYYRGNETYIYKVLSKYFRKKKIQKIKENV